MFKAPLYISGMAVALVLCAGGVAAQPGNSATCYATYKTCSSACRSGNTVPQSVVVACQRECTADVRSCSARGSAAAQASPSTPDPSRGERADPPAGDLQAAPLPQGSSRSAAAGTPLREAEIMAAIKALVPPRGYAPLAYFQTLDPDPQGILGQVMRGLEPIGQSFDTELASLPSDPLQRFHALNGLSQKYASFWSYLEESRRQIARTNSQAFSTPLLRFADDHERRRQQAVERAQASPAVRQAYAAGNLPRGQVNLSKNQEAEWNADKATVVLRARIGGTSRQALFIDRTSDTSRSAREQANPTGYASWNEPTAHEIGLAILRALAVDGGEIRSASEASRVGPTNVALSATNTAIVYVTRVVHLEKNDCRRSDSGFVCSVRLWALNFMKGGALEMLAASGMSTRHRAEIAFVAAGFDADGLQGKSTQIAIVATPNGWVAPAIAKGIVDDETKVARGMEVIAEQARQRARDCRQRDLQVNGAPEVCF